MDKCIYITMQFKNAFKTNEKFLIFEKNVKTDYGYYIFCMFIYLYITDKVVFILLY